VFVDHSSINRWAIRFLPLLEKAFRRKHKRPVGVSGVSQTTQFYTGRCFALCGEQK